jgi:predicted PurR-regulated permease PerM
VAVVPEQMNGRRDRETRAERATVVTVAPRTIVLFTVVVIAALLLLVFAYFARTILVQTIVAIVLAMAAEPVVQAFERRGVPRGKAVGISFALLALAMIGFAYLLFAPVVDEATKLAHNAPDLVRQLVRGDGRFGFLESRLHVVERTREAIDSGRLTASAGPALEIVNGAVRTTAAVVFVAFLTLFVQLGGRQWFDSLVGLAPEAGRVRLRRTGKGISAAVGGYVTGNLAISVVAGTVTTLVLLVVSAPYPVALGLVVAVFDLVPLVGATIGTVIVGLTVLATRGVVTAAIVVAALIVYQQIENHVLQQVVYHRTVKLSPLAIALSVAIGAEVGGVVGALLGIPFAGALKVVASEVLAWRRGEDAPPQPAGG